MTLSSIASFQRSGLLYDGNGIEPDIYMENEPGFFLVNGPDKVLEAAIQIILTNRKP